MKTSIRILVAIFMMSSVFMLSGCKKYSEYLSHGYHGDAWKYKIGMITYQPPYVSFTDTIRFTYNEYGNPIKGLRSEVRTGSPNYLFKYDRFQRMIALISPYGTTENDGIETWTKYTYDVKGRIVKDSVWVFPNVVNGEPILHSHSAMTVCNYEYDTKDRISKVITWLYIGAEPMITEYSYDSNGNRVGTAYDDKVNYHLTNKVWMFLSRDYSVNNPIVGTYTYNKADLPLTIEGYTNFLLTPFDPILFTKASITYVK
jgi:hypothetical protein